VAVLCGFLLYLDFEPFCCVYCCAVGGFGGVFAAGGRAVDVEVGANGYEDGAEDCAYLDSIDVMCLLTLN
jgi:hypothetical protein